MNILFLYKKLPDQKNHGEDLRILFISEFLSKLHNLHLICLSDKQLLKKDINNFQESYPFYKKVSIIPIYKSNFIKKVLFFFSKSPNSFLKKYFKYDTKKLKKFIESYCNENRIDIVHYFSFSLVSVAFSLSPSKWHIFDLVDSPYLYLKRSKIKKSIIKRIQLINQQIIIKNICRWISSNFSRIVFVSPVDSNYHEIHFGGNCIVIGNGIKVKNSPPYFKNHKNREQFSIVTGGNLDWPPTLNAVEYFANHIFPIVRKNIPQSKLYIYGINKKYPVNIFDKTGIILTGYINNLNEFLNDKCIMAATLIDGSGIKNKVLDAVAAGCPVVGTKLAFEAFDIDFKEYLLEMNDIEGLASSICSLIIDTEKRNFIANNAFKILVKNYTWEIISSKYDNLYNQIKGV